MRQISDLFRNLENEISRCCGKYIKMYVVFWQV